MANDRITLRCSVCNETHLAMKYYPSRVSFYNPTTTAAWIHEHLLICAGAGMFIECMPFEWLSEKDEDG